MGPFWQPFVFEQLEGICQRCGSLHLSGSCSSPASDSSTEASLFGEWMSAVRQRKVSKGPQAEVKEKMLSGAVPVSLGPRSSSSGVVSASGTTIDGGSAQLKSARRRRSRGILAVGKLAGSSGHDSEAMAKEAPVVVSKAKGSERAGSKESVPVSVALQLSEHFPSKSMLSNPFASLDLESGGVSLLGTTDACLGPLKRAHPAEYQAPRLISRMDKKKGKGEVSSTKSKLVQVRVTQHLKGDLGASGVNRSKGAEGEKNQPILASGSSSDLLTSATPGKVPIPRSSYNSPRTDEVQDAMICSEAGTRSSGCHPDSDMVEVQGGSQLPLPVK